MIGYRFLSLRENPRQGILLRAGFGAAIAEFLTPEQAKAIAQAKVRP